MCLAPHRRALFPQLNFQKSSATDVFCHFLIENVLRATTVCTFSTFQLPKVLRELRVLPLFTWKCASRHNGVHFFNIPTSKSRPNPTCFALFTCKCASRHNGVHFFDISTSKSRPKPRCFATFYFQMCFAPQRRAIFHLSSAQMSPHPPL